MKEKYQTLRYKTKANDLDEAKGIVTVAVNGIGIVDSQNDISMPGSFKKTLKENIGRMRWFLNHDTTQLLGKPLSGSEDGSDLVMVGQLNLKKSIGRDTLADYQLYAENGGTLEHSIGVQAIKRDKVDTRKVLEWKMWEYSTLTSWGSNPRTFLIDVKNDGPESVKENIELIRRALQLRYSDERLKYYEMRLDLLTKALQGELVVACPHCGTEFSWDDAEKRTYESQVLDTAAMYVRWITEDVVQEEMSKLEPGIRSAVLDILNPILSKCDGSVDAALVEKSIQDFAEYAFCPHCYSRVYKSSVMQGHDEAEEGDDAGEPSGDTRGDISSKAEEAAGGTSFWAGMTEIVTN